MSARDSGEETGKDRVQDLGQPRAELERSRAEVEGPERAPGASAESDVRFAAAFDASPDLMAVTRFSDGVILAVNQAYTRVLGYSREESEGRRTSELGIWADLGDRDTFVSTLRATGRIDDFETRLRRKDGTVIDCVDSARTLDFGGERCILSIVHDVTQQKRVTAELARRELELREAQRLGRLGSWAWDATSDTITWSDEYYRIYGFDPQQAPPGYREHLSAYTPESAARLDEAVQRGLETGEPYVLDLELASPRGTCRWVTARSEAVRDGAGRITGLRGTVQDITEGKTAELSLLRLNREMQAVMACNEALLRAEDEMQLLKEICRIICDVAGFRMAWVGFAEDDEARTLRPIAWAGAEEGYLAQARLTWADTERGRGPGGVAVRTGRSSVFRDFATDSAAATWRDAALARGYRSCIGVPLKSETGRPFGALGIYSARPDSFDESDVRLVEDLAGDLAIGIGLLRARIRLHAAEEEHAEHLRFFQGMDRIDRIIQGAEDPGELEHGVLDVALAMLDCDRGWLASPTEPEATIWRLEAVRGRPDEGGGPSVEEGRPVEREEADRMSTVLGVRGPVAFGPGEDRPSSDQGSGRSGSRSMLATSVRPKGRGPLVFCVQDSEGDRAWSPEDTGILQEAGHRLADALGDLLSRERVRQSERKLAEAEGIARVGYLDRDTASGRVELSAETLRIFGLSLDEPTMEVGRWNEAWSSRIHPTDRPRVLAALASALARDLPYDEEYRIVLPDGEERVVHSRARADRTPGSARRFLGTVQDVTERRRIEDQVRDLNAELESRVRERTAELEAANRALQAANRELESFSYSVSHDLRAPLRAIDGYSSLLEEEAGSRLGDEDRRMVQRIRHGAVRMGRLIDDLLRLSRSGRTELRWSPVDLVQVVAEVTAELVPEADGNRTDVKVGDLPEVWGDPGLLRVVVQNLLSNALKYSATRERRVVEVGARSGSAGPELFVRDNGVGFDPRFSAKLFGVFQRLHSDEAFEGTGIGLALVKRIVERHGGRVWAEGEVEKGATFWFSLPGSPGNRD